VRKGLFVLSQLQADGNGLILWNWNYVPLLAILLLPILSCSGVRELDKANTEAAASKERSASDGELPPILRTAWKGDLDQIAKRRVMRVLVPVRRPEFFYVDGKPAGVLNEAFREVERVLNARFKTKAGEHIVVALLPTPLDRFRERMSGGYGDVAAGSISITSENEAIVDFTSPTMTGLKIIAVTGPGAPLLNSLDDLSGKDVWVMPQTRLKNDIESFNAKLRSQGKAPATVREADPVLEPGDIMEMVNAGVYPVALMQSQLAEFWAQVFDNVKPRMDLALAESVETGWAIQKNTPQLKAFLDEFIKAHGVGTAFGNTVLRRYLKDAKYVKNATQVNELKKFRATAPVFKKYSQQYDLENLLIVAQGYQESGLDQTVKSPVGAIGIMQVMPATAAGHPVKVQNIHNEENNIHAGVRLMHFLIEDHFNEPGLDRINRMLFAIAAYNAGPAKITRCRAMAKEMGYDSNKWFGNVEVAVAKVVGRETTQYVSNIYKYYLSYRLASESVAARQVATEKARSKAESK
jgi:membrane-bound lytic murein transglycosylase MltF